MRPKLACVTWGVAFVCLLACAALAAPAEPKLEAQLLWGTNDKTSPNPNHKPIEPSVKKRLEQLPLKFTNYFEVNRKVFTLPATGSRKVHLSEKCGIEVSKHGEDDVEISLVGKGEHVAKRIQPLPKGEMLVLGGNAPNKTAWLIVVKRLD